MDRSELKTDVVPAPTGSYSQGISAGGFLFLAGQWPATPEGIIVTESFRAQARQVFRNLDGAARAAGARLADAVQVRVFLSDLTEFAEMDEEYRAFVADPLPARTTIGCHLAPSVRIEADAVVWLGGASPPSSGTAAR